MEQVVFAASNEESKALVRFLVSGLIIYMRIYILKTQIFYYLSCMKLNFGIYL